MVAVVVVIGVVVVVDDDDGAVWLVVVSFSSATYQKQRCDALFAACCELCASDGICWDRARTFWAWK